MGSLVAWHYPTILFAKLADHTYVACGNGGKAWSCWGGKTGGAPLRQGSGSTLRADAIAEPDERANIKCYLVNGVCHQAANRILFPAGIIVQGAKGYWISEAMFGTYGRPRGALGFCNAPFHQYPHVTGDLPECQVRPRETEVRETAAREPGIGAARLATYLEQVAAAYREIEPRAGSEGLDDAEVASFQLELFRMMVDLRLGEELEDRRSREALLEHRRSVEKRRQELEHAFFHHELSVRQFVDAFNELTIELQHRAAETLDGDRYQALFGLPREETVVVGDPAVAEAAYPTR